MNIFVSSQVFRFGAARLGGVSLSLATHAGLITLAVVGTGATASFADVRISKAVPAERVLYVKTHEPEGNAAREAERAARARAAARAARWVVPDLLKLRAAIDASLVAVPNAPGVIADVDLAALAAGLTSASDFGDADTGFLIASSRVFAQPGRDGAYSENDVERTAWPKRGNPHPSYPASLLREGVEGSFPVQFVVDSTGRVDAKTMAFPQSAHPMFVRAVKQALLRSRFLPAELAGSRVRQLVQQQFTFVIGR